MLARVKDIRDPLSQEFLTGHTEHFASSPVYIRVLAIRRCQEDTVDRLLDEPLITLFTCTQAAYSLLVLDLRSFPFRDVANCTEDQLLRTRLGQRPRRLDRQVAAVASAMNGIDTEGSRTHLVEVLREFRACLGRPDIGDVSGLEFVERVAVCS